MTLKPIVVAVAAAALSTGAFAGGDQKHQPRAEGGAGMTQSQAGQHGQSQGGQQQSGSQQQAQSPQVVKQAQQALKDKGLNAGPVDGQWGPQTAQAVKQFQQQQQIQATGQLDQQTLASLGIQEQSSSAGSSSRSATGASGGSGGSSGSSAPPSGGPAGAYHSGSSGGSGQSKKFE